MSRTATRMSRYGIPQITHMDAKSSQLRRVMPAVPSVRARGGPNPATHARWPGTAR